MSSSVYPPLVKAVTKSFDSGTLGLSRAREFGRARTVAGHVPDASTCCVRQMAQGTAVARSCIDISQASCRLVAAFLSLKPP
jgi:hypothetical protein